MAELKYRSFDSLMASVESSLKKYADNNLIQRRNYIKVAKAINANLGLKINRILEDFITVENFRANIPKNFLTALLAMATTVEVVGTMHGGIPGTRTILNSKEEIISKNLVPKASEACISSCNGCYWVTRLTTNETLVKDQLIPLAPSMRSLKFFSRKSPNLTCSNTYQIDLEDEIFNFNFQTGEIYLAYIADMEDDEGNLLVLDHDLVNDYYEKRIAKEILLELYNQGEDTYDRYKNMRDIELPPAKKKAEMIVTFPEYRILRDYNNRLLQDFYNQYFTI